MIISMIVAAGQHNEIGIHNNLPWHLPKDLKFFKQTTLGKPVIMGRKTFDSLGGKPLPGRLNIVLSRQEDLSLPEGVLHFNDIRDAIARLEEEKNEEGFIIGGGKIFEESIDLADRLYITRVETTVAGADAFFPHIDHSHWHMDWEEAHEADEKHAFPFTFQRYERIAL
ncbi:dihydrofolate reductase [Chitinophagaceae bacterium MMS25-I14]